METELLMLRLGVEAWCTETRRLREALSMTMSDATEGEDRPAPVEVPPHPGPQPVQPVPDGDDDGDEVVGGEDPRPMETPPG